MKAKSMFLVAALAFCLVFGLVAAAFAAFPDINGHWAQAQLEKWVEQGLAKGYPDGTFKPDNQVTRAEFVALLNRAWDNQNPGAKCDFTDVKASDWYYQEVAAVAEAGYVSGYGDKTFRPNNPINRVEAGAIIARLLKLPAGDESALAAFKDAAAIGAWAKGSISALAAEKLLGGYPDGTFKPANPITRAEAIVLIDRSLAYSGEGGEVIPVTGVKLNKDKLSLSVSSTAQLEATVEPADATNKNVTWSSSDEEIATVDETGKVKGIKVGKATITVTTKDGNRTATCEVNVYRSGGGGGGGGSSKTVSVTLVPTASGIGNVATVNITGYENAAQYRLLKNNLVLTNKVNVGSTVVVLYLKPDETCVVELYKADGTILDTVTVECQEAAPSAKTVSVTLVPTASGIGNVATVNITGYENAAQYRLLKDNLVLTNKVNVGSTVVVLYLKPDETCVVELYKADGTLLATETVVALAQ